MRGSIAWLVCVALALSCATRVREETALEPRAIFDGHSLAGWDGDARFWRVEDGAIVGESTAANPCNETTYLVWRGGEVGDFEFLCQFKIEGGNSGVQFRSREVSAHAIAGYQADIEDGPSWTGCVYEQDGRGVMAKRGERVVFDPERHAIALEDAGELLGRVRTHDWNEYAIRAVGPRIELEINGVRMVELVDRDAARASSRGLIALQLHQGPPMRVAFRNLRLRKLAGAPISERASSTLVWTGAPPQWIWSSAKASEGELATFEREFEIPFDVARATARFAGDDHVRVFLNGDFVRRSDAWWQPLEVDVTRLVSRGTNAVALIDKNDKSEAAAWFELVVEGARGERLRLISDASWSCAPLAAGATFDDWKPSDFDSSRASAPHSFGAYGVEPWGSTGGASATKADEPSDALAGDEIELPEGFRCELLYSVPKETQGSWVSLCEDDRGRLYASDQYGPLYRITPAPIGADASATRVEKLALDMGKAQGLCWAFDSLYVVVSDGDEHDHGLYRVRDSNGDGELDDAKLLRKFEGSGEHGPHAVVLGPDGKTLWIIAGNHTKLPEPIDVYRLPKTWGEDHLLPVIEDPNGHAVGIRAPGGWVARTDENGERWELWCGGLRNAYDLAFDAEGEAFTYDSDMEWDMGAPWYKPPRFVHVVSGADFGWRSGTANWPIDYPDTLPSVCETGPASPTGMVFGTNAKFPEKYRRALFGLDWAYGTIYAVHLEPKGSSFTGTAEKFATGKPFPVTDAVIARDGAMYVATGGRKTQSGLYRITWTRDVAESAASIISETDSAEWALRDVRAGTETRHGLLLDRNSPVDRSLLVNEAIERTMWDIWSNDDPHIRYAARIAFEHLPSELWPQTAIASRLDSSASEFPSLAIALMHADPISSRTRLLEALCKRSLSDAPQLARLDLARLFELALVRLGPFTEGELAECRSSIDLDIPSGSTRLDRELAMLLVHLESPRVIEPLLATMESDAAQEEKIHAAYCLRAMKSGWSLEQRKRFFIALDELRKTAKGGHSLVKYVEEIRKQSIDALSDDEKRELGALVEAPKSIEAGAGPAATFVKRWTKDELLAELREPLHARSLASGKSAFAKASCLQCHRIAGEGGATGPDLTGAGSRFSARDLVEAIVEPSKAISDQYQDVEVRTRDGDLYVGRVEGERDGVLTFRRLPPQEDVVELELAEIESRRLHPLSRMPSGLLDVLTRDEVLDLFAYVLAGGDPANAAFR